MEPVFILGCSRTGSKIYKNILNEHTPVHIMHELHFLSPSIIRRDFVARTKKEISTRGFDEMEKKDISPIATTLIELFAFKEMKELKYL